MKKPEILKKRHKMTYIDDFRNPIVDKNIDEKDESILKELIKDPRVSDNKISKTTKIPLKTVNRKRKKLEEKNIIMYFTGVNNYSSGTGVFGTIQFITLYFDYGISRKQILDILSDNSTLKDKIWKKHILMDWLGEKDARVTYHLIVESRVESDIIDIVNVEILPRFQNMLGKECVKNIETISNVHVMRAIHNYMPYENMEKGKLREDEDDIFVT